MLIKLLLSAIVAAGQGTPSWLDRPVTNWNKPGAAIPMPPKDAMDREMASRCSSTLRKAETAVDKKVTAAGWHLFGSVQSYAGTSVVLGLAGFDGMCRPLSFHAFVFVNDEFAGTLTPAVMNSRADGVEGRIALNTATTLYVEFSRYKDSDALCCPSGRSSVQYQITRNQGKATLVPGNPVRMNEDAKK